MRSQSEIIAAFQEVIMEILKTGTVSPADAERMDALETELDQHPSFMPHTSGKRVGEAIASLLFDNKLLEAVHLMIEHNITLKDFFEFVDYFYDEDHEDEDKVDMFTDDFIANLQKIYHETK